MVPVNGTRRFTDISIRKFTKGMLRNIFSKPIEIILNFNLRKLVSGQVRHVVHRGIRYLVTLTNHNKLGSYGRSLVSSSGGRKNLTRVIKKIASIVIRNTSNIGTRTLFDETVRKKIININIRKVLNAVLVLIADRIRDSKSGADNRGTGVQAPP